MYILVCKICFLYNTLCADITMTEDPYSNQPINNNDGGNVDSMLWEDVDEYVANLYDKIDVQLLSNDADVELDQLLYDVDKKYHTIEDNKDVSDMEMYNLTKSKHDANDSFISIIEDLNHIEEIFESIDTSGEVYQNQNCDIRTHKQIDIPSIDNLRLDTPALCNPSINASCYNTTIKNLSNNNLKKDNSSKDTKIYDTLNNDRVTRDRLSKDIAINALLTDATLLNATPINATPINTTPINTTPTNATSINATPLNAQSIFVTPTNFATPTNSATFNIFKSKSISNRPSKNPDTTITTNATGIDKKPNNIELRYECMVDAKGFQFHSIHVNYIEGVTTNKAEFHTSSKPQTESILSKTKTTTRQNSYVKSKILSKKTFATGDKNFSKQKILFANSCKYKNKSIELSKYDKIYHNSELYKLLTNYDTCTKSVTNMQYSNSTTCNINVNNAPKFLTNKMLLKNYQTPSENINIGIIPIINVTNEKQLILTFINFISIQFLQAKFKIEPFFQRKANSFLISYHYVIKVSKLDIASEFNLYLYKLRDINKSNYQILHKITYNFSTEKIFNQYLITNYAMVLETYKSILIPNIANKIFCFFISNTNYGKQVSSEAENFVLKINSVSIHCSNLYFDAFKKELKKSKNGESHLICTKTDFDYLLIYCFWMHILSLEQKIQKHILLSQMFATLRENVEFVKPTYNQAANNDRLLYDKFINVEKCKIFDIDILYNVILEKLCYEESELLIFNDFFDCWKENCKSLFFDDFTYSYILEKMFNTKKLDDVKIILYLETAKAYLISLFRNLDANNVIHKYLIELKFFLHYLILDTYKSRIKIKNLECLVYVGMLFIFEYLITVLADLDFTAFYTKEHYSYVSIQNDTTRTVYMDVRFEIQRIFAHIIVPFVDENCLNCYIEKNITEKLLWSFYPKVIHNVPKSQYVDLLGRNSNSFILSRIFFLIFTQNQNIISSILKHPKKHETLLDFNTLSEEVAFAKYFHSPLANNFFVKKIAYFLLYVWYNTTDNIIRNTEIN